MIRLHFFCAVLLLPLAAVAFSQATGLPEEVTSEHNAGKRSEIAVTLADKSIDQARSYYRAGDAARGDSELDLVRQLADECFSSAERAHKSKYWKKAEMRIAALSRRVRSLTEELGYEQREKGRDLADHLDSIHDKLLAGVMSK
jgi:hypothetical protein